MNILHYIKKRKIYPILRFLTDGILFMLLCLLLLIAASSLKTCFRNRSSIQSLQQRSISGLSYIEPRLSQFIDSNDSNAMLIFLGFDCRRCIRFWNELKDYIYTLDNNYGIVLILQSITADDPIFNLLYDQERKVHNYFRIENIPCLIVIENNEITGVYNSANEILKWAQECSL